VPGLHRVLTRSLTVTRYLGVHALVSFAFAFGALTLFFQLAEEIGVDEDLAHFDLLLSSALATYASQGLLRFLAIITVLGNKEFLLPFGTLVTLILVMQRHRILAVAWVIATGTGSLLNMALKAVFERTRPVHEHGFITEDGWSFPSGHASGSMLVYGLLAYILIRHTPRAWHLPVAITAVTLIVFVGFSRVLLQVHYLSDVLAGYASASAWGALCIAGYESVRRAKARNARAEEL
jgi:undecaprenyl-diphosphatase